MAISGTTFTVTPTSTTNNTTGRVVWSYTQDEDHNQSTVTATLQFKNGGVHTTITQVPSFYITIDGQTSPALTDPIRYDIGTSWVTVLTYSATVNHNADGTKSLTIVAGGGLNQTTGLPNSYGTGTFDLQVIPRGSKLGTISGTGYPNIGGNWSISIVDPTNGSNYHELKYTFTGRTTISGNIGDSAMGVYQYSWRPTYSVFGPAIPDRATGTMTVELTSYTSSEKTTQRGEKDVKTFEVTFPSNEATVPELQASSPLSVEDTVNGQGTTTKVAELIGAYVQNASKPKFTAKQATARFGATIKTYTFQFENVVKTSYGSSAETYSQYFDTISSSSNQICTLIVTDSRGFTSITTLTVNILPYETPSITSNKAKRASSTPTTINVTTSAKVKSLKLSSSSPEKNEIHVFAAYRLASGSTFLNEAELTYRSSDPVTVDGFMTVTNAERAITGTNDSSSYEVRVTVKDKIAAYSQVYKVGTASVGLHIGSTWLGVGKIHEVGALDVGGNILGNPNIVATDAKKQSASDGKRGAILNRLGRLYLQGDSSNSPQINFLGNGENTSPTSTIQELTDGELTVNANVVGATGKTIKAENLPDISDEYLSAVGTKSFTLATRHTYMVICTRHGGTMDTADVRIIALGINGVNTNAPISTASFVTVSTSGTTLSVTTSETYVRVTVIDLGSYL